MRRLTFIVWALVGLAAAAVGWALGGVAGGFWPRTVLAAAFAAGALGLLMGRARFAVGLGFLVAAAAAAGYLLGTKVFSPVIAWPIAGLVMGVAASSLVARLRSKIILIVLAPTLAMLGFILGAAGVALYGTIVAKDGRIASEFMMAGAAGFGLLALGFFGIVRRRFGLIAEGGAQ